MAELVALETRYAGCRFRSRTEARWAVFFDALRITWEYEPDAFATSEGNYLPDFRLQGGLFAEVKPDSDDTPWRTKVEAFAREHNEPVLLLIGPPSTAGLEQVRPNEPSRWVRWTGFSESGGKRNPHAIALAVAAAKGARFDRGEDVEMPRPAFVAPGPTWDGYIRSDETDEELRDRARIVADMASHANNDVLEHLYRRALRRLTNELERRNTPPRATRADFSMDAILGGSR